MKVIIVEDEYSATENMLALLKEIDRSITVLATLEGVEETVSWITENPQPDLGFFDIQLADGNSFEIFDNCDVNFPVVFTTAFNEYALKAFKVNSIDYLLKPIKQSELEFAIEKHKKLTDRAAFPPDSVLRAALQRINSTLNASCKKTLLIRKGDGFVPVAAADFCYFYIKHGQVHGVSRSGESYDIDDTLDSLAEQLSSDDFFRANRQYIVARKAVTSVAHYFNGRLVVRTDHPSPEKIIVSKARAGVFKRWLER